MEDSKELTVSEMPPMPLVALTPGELVAAQTSLKDWCSQKLAYAKEAFDDAQTNLAHARKAKWKMSSFQNRVTEATRLVIFYEKVQATLEAGYLIIPNFPVDLFAVRVDSRWPKGHWNWTTSEWSADQIQPPIALPAGEGEYKSRHAVVESKKEFGKYANGESYSTELYRPAEFREVEFPVTVAKPKIIEATERAMALRMFDQLGLIGQQHASKYAPRADPIVVGQLIDPRSKYRDKKLTFFIAWWFNWEML